VSRFPNVKTQGFNSSPGAVNLASPLECLGRTKTNSYWSTTVLTSPLRAHCIFSLVYIDLTEFGLYVDRHGDPSRSFGTIEWEGTAEKAAWHPPYVLLFDSRFIEVRHVETGRLAQIIPGNDVRCIWDGRNASIPAVQTPGPDGWQETISQEARVHGVMRAPETTNTHGPQRAAKAVPQLVCELVPTIPLYLPGALSSPNTSTYFPQSNSPPHSPHLTHRPSWN
jgi:RHO1 GDP-GTP exchange protein 1/2